MFHVKQPLWRSLLLLGIGIIGAWPLAWLQTYWEQAHIFQELEGKTLPVCRSAE
jgi:hypothetical protein